MFLLFLENHQNFILSFLTAILKFPKKNVLVVKSALMSVPIKLFLLIPYLTLMKVNAINAGLAITNVQLKQFILIIIKKLVIIQNQMIYF